MPALTERESATRFSKYAAAFEGIPVTELMADPDVVARVECSGSEGYYVECIRWSDSASEWQRYAFLKLFEIEEANRFEAAINANAMHAPVFSRIKPASTAKVELVDCSAIKIFTGRKIILLNGAVVSDLDDWHDAPAEYIATNMAKAMKCELTILRPAVEELALRAAIENNADLELESHIDNGGTSESFLTYYPLRANDIYRAALESATAVKS